MSSKNNDDGKQKRREKYSHLNLAIAFGLLGGAVVSSIFTMFIKTPLVMVVGPALGVLIGIVISSAMD